MSRSRRFTESGEHERPLPERPRLEPDFIPYVLGFLDLHDRPAPPSSRPFALDGPCLRTYAEHKVKAHETCFVHWPEHVNRFGDGWCRCGAAMWSPWWVADGLYGLCSALSGTRVNVVDLSIEQVDEHFDGTAAWIVEHEETWKVRVSMERND